VSAQIPRYIVWSTDHVDTSDPFQRRWLLRQTLLHGRAQDIRRLDFDEVRRELDTLDLPPHIDSLWRTYLNQPNEPREPADR
jgi:hypothetical protein